MHLDGCGASPDANDWVLDCVAQIQFREYLDLLVANLMRRDGGERGNRSLSVSKRRRRLGNETSEGRDSSRPSRREGECPTLQAARPSSPHWVPAPARGSLRSTAAGQLGDTSAWSATVPSAVAPQTEVCRPAAGRFGTVGRMN